MPHHDFPFPPPMCRYGDLHPRKFRHLCRLGRGAEIEQHNSTSRSHATLIAQQVVATRDRHRPITADGECVILLAIGDQAPVQRQNRFRFFGEAIDIAAFAVRRHRQPRRSGGETRMGRAVPLHRRALWIASQPQARFVALPRIFDKFQRNGNFSHADLIAIIERRRAAQSQQQHRRDTRLRHPDARGDARLIVVTQHPVWPMCLRDDAIIFRDHRSNPARVPRRLQKLEIERQMRLAHVLAVIGDQPLDRQINFSDQHAVFIAVDDFTDLLYDAVDVGMIGGIKLQIFVDFRLMRLIGGIGRIVPEFGILHQMPQHINAKTIDTAIQPEAQHIVHRSPYFRISPIQVRLCFEEGVVIVLTSRRIPFPGGAAEIADPVIGRTAIRLRSPPDIPVPFRIIPR